MLVSKQFNSIKLFGKFDKKVISVLEQSNLSNFVYNDKSKIPLMFNDSIFNRTILVGYFSNI
jgi:hypothetical protein